MTKDEILWEVTLLFRDTLDVPNLVLRPETTAKDVEQWDSLTHVELVAAVEKHFKIRFDSRTVQRFKNVGEMCDAIARGS
jgi:acyl carrier protein